MNPVSPVIPRCKLPEVVYAENQPEYIPLPVIKQRDGVVTSRWHLSWRDRLSLLFHGDVYLQVATFNRPLQPSRISAEPPSIHWMDCVDVRDAEKAKQN